MSAPCPSRNLRTARMSSAVRTNDTATKSTPCSMPNLRSSTSLSVRQEAGRSTCGSEMPLWSLMRPPAATTQCTSVGVVASTRSWIMPSSIQISSPGLTRPRYSGGETKTRSLVPTQGVRQSVNGRPASRSTRRPPPSPNVPSRIFGPCRSCRMATGRPQRASASRMRRMTSACSACVPCEKLSRATSMPAAARRSSCSTVQDAGPIVQTIFVRRIALRRPRAAERGTQELARVRLVGLTHERLRCAGGDQAAALVAALGAEVDDPVGGLDDVEVVLDDHHGVAVLDQPVQHLEQLLDVREVQPRRRLVEDIEGAAGRPARQLGGELHALRLAARERGGRLAEPDVVQADVVERLQLLLDHRHGFEELQRLVH